MESAGAFPYPRGMASRKASRPRTRPAARRPTRRRGDASPLGETLRRLKDTEAQLLAHVGCWEWDAGLDRVTWSEELYRVYGVKPGEFDGSYEGFLSRVYEPDRQ